MPLQSKSVQKNKAFSLIEVTIAILIISILASVSIQYYLSVLIDGRRARAKNDLACIAKASIRYYTKYSKWPKSVLELSPRFIESNITDPWGRNYTLYTKYDPAGAEDEKYGFYIGCLSKRFNNNQDGGYTQTNTVHWQLVDSSEINLN